MTKQVIFALMAQALLAMADGKISFDEVSGMLEMIAKMCGFSKSDFHEVFMEADGDLHFIIKKSALDKMSIGV